MLPSYSVIADWPTVGQSAMAGGSYVNYKQPTYPFLIIPLHSPEEAGLI